MKPIATRSYTTRKCSLTESTTGTSLRCTPARWLIAVLALTHTAGAAAYVGPGAGLTAIGSFLALLATVVLGIVGFLWYPIKRLMRRFGAVKNPQTRTQGNTAQRVNPEKTAE